MVLTASQAFLAFAKACSQISLAVELDTLVISSIFLKDIAISRHLKVTIAVGRHGVMSFPII